MRPTANCRLRTCCRPLPAFRFGAWLRHAALQGAPEEAPWRRWKPEAQEAAVADLLSPLCAQDARRFKRLLKVGGAAALCVVGRHGLAGVGTHLHPMQQAGLQWWHCPRTVTCRCLRVPAGVVRRQEEGPASGSAGARRLMR